MKDDLNRECHVTHDLLINYPWAKRECYAEWLAQTYYYVCHSTRLLCLSASKMATHQSNHHLRMIDHMREERSHELLCEADLKDLGFSVDDFKEGHATKMLYAQNYYRLMFESPLSLYGYIICLEGIAVHSGDSLTVKVKKAYPHQGAHRFLSVHAGEDPDHLVKALAMVEKLDTSDQEAVYSSMKSSFWLYREMIRAASKSAHVTAPSDELFVLC